MNDFDVFAFKFQKNQHTRQCELPFVQGVSTMPCDCYSQICANNIESHGNYIYVIM